MNNQEISREAVYRHNMYQACCDRAYRTALFLWNDGFAKKYPEDKRNAWVTAEQRVILHEDYGWFQMENRDELLQKRDALLETPEDYRDRDAEWATQGLTYEQLSRGY